MIADHVTASIAALEALVVAGTIKGYADAVMGTAVTISTVAALTVNVSADVVSATGVHTLTVIALNTAAVTFTRIGAKTA